jgi:hypothetical protein
VASGEDEAVTIEPLGFRRIVAQAASTEEYSTNFRTSQWEAEVTGTTGVDCVDCESACVGGCFGENLCLHSLCLFEATRCRWFCRLVKVLQDAPIPLDEKQKGIFGTEIVISGQIDTGL